MLVKISTVKEEDGAKLAASSAVHVVDMDSGAHLEAGISSLKVIIEPDDAVRAEARILVAALDIEGAVLRYLVTEPGTDARKIVTRMEFADGTSWEEHSLPERAAR